MTSPLPMVILQDLPPPLREKWLSFLIKREDVRFEAFGSDSFAARIRLVERVEEAFNEENESAAGKEDEHGRIARILKDVAERKLKGASLPPYAEFCALLVDPVRNGRADPKKKALNWVLKIVNEVYLRRQGENDWAAKRRPPDGEILALTNVFSVFVYDHFCKGYGLRKLVEQVGWDFVYNVHAHRRTSAMVDAFAKFLDGEYDYDDLLFYLHSREVYTKRFGPLERPVSSQAELGYFAKVVHGRAERLRLNFLDTAEEVLQKFPVECESVLVLALRNYHDTRIEIAQGLSIDFSVQASMLEDTRLMISSRQQLHQQQQQQLQQPMLNTSSFSVLSFASFGEPTSKFLNGSSSPSSPLSPLLRSPLATTRLTSNTKSSSSFFSSSPTPEVLESPAPQALNSSATATVVAASPHAHSVRQSSPAYRQHTTLSNAAPHSPAKIDKRSAISMKSTLREIEEVQRRIHEEIESALKPVLKPISPKKRPSSARKFLSLGHPSSEAISVQDGPGQVLRVMPGRIEVPRGSSPDSSSSASPYSSPRHYEPLSPIKTPLRNGFFQNANGSQLESQSHAPLSPLHTDAGLMPHIPMPPPPRPPLSVRRVDVTREDPATTLQRNVARCSAVWLDRWMNAQTSLSLSTRTSVRRQGADMLTRCVSRITNLIVSGTHVHDNKKCPRRNGTCLFDSWRHTYVTVASLMANPDYELKIKEELKVLAESIVESELVEQDMKNMVSNMSSAPLPSLVDAN